MVKCVSVKLVTILCYLVSIVRYMSIHEFRYGHPVYQHDTSIFLGLTTPVKILEFHQLWEFLVEKTLIFFQLVTLLLVEIPSLVSERR